jgi:hypothetical protein
VLHVVNINDVIPFHRDVLGFRLSDYMTRPFNAYSSTPTHGIIRSPSLRPAAAPHTT